jgi:type I restriction enzyme R subunit
MDLTQNKKYGAMLTLGSIDEAYKCWKWFKENYQDINVGCIFSTEPNGEESEEDMKTGKEKLQEILESYNKEYGANYSINNYYSYQGNLANNIKNGVVDLTIVVNVFTTGFDAKRINTMYIAKELKMHNIIQTFARSCRNYENKQIANIRCLLRTSKKDVKEAFGYYAKGVDVEKIIKPYVMDYTKIVNLINLIIDQIINIAPTPEDARNNQSDDFVKQYIQLIRKLSFNIDNFFLTFDEKQWSDLKLSYDTILQYRSIAGSLLQKYKEIIAIENKSINPNSYIEEIEMNELVNKSIITNND